MAKYEMGLPDEIIDDLNTIYDNADEIFGKMTRAGAEVVKKSVESRLPTPEMNGHVKLTKTYKTPSDDGINTQVYLSGYMPFKGNRKYFARKGGSGKVYKTSKGVPVDFVANVFEYGRTGYPFPKKPFFRKAFNQKAKIEKAMLEEQKRASGGLLDDE